jgi:flavin reductase (DIM6/NTAB) family NADH-FMN oxidoreductase RutF
MTKKIIQPNTTLYPVPIVLITTGGDRPNVMTCNRIASCSAEPPRLSISVRPSRYSHNLIRETREFVVNFPTPEQQALTDYLGVVTGREEDKIGIAGLRLTPALRIKTPLLAACPVNVECMVEQTLDLDSHTLFIGRVIAVHAEESLLDARDDVDLSLAQGLLFGCGTVREKPVGRFRVADLRRQAARSGSGATPGSGV